MKIYFAGSIRGGRDDQRLYEEIINYLKEFGTLLTEHIGDKRVTQLGGMSSNAFEMSDENIYKKDVNWIDEADIVIAEVTQVSLGVGYEIGYAENKKPVICLYRSQEGKRLSAMLAGNPKLKIIDYTTLEELRLKLKKIINYL